MKLFSTYKGLQHHVKKIQEKKRTLSYSKFCISTLKLNLNLGGLFRGLFWSGRKVGVWCGWGVKLPHTSCLKLVRIILETWNLVQKCTHIWSFRKYAFKCQGSLNFADVIIFCKNSAVFAKNGFFTQINSVRAVWEIFLFCFQFF